jgi:hypothetical protein
MSETHCNSASPRSDGEELSDKKKVPTKTKESEFVYEAPEPQPFA